MSLLYQELIIYIPFNITTIVNRSNYDSGIVRTAKAERRAQSREGKVNEEEQLSPADRRRAEAEKRAAWRQARLKSLENVRSLFTCMISNKTTISS